MLDGRDRGARQDHRRQGGAVQPALRDHPPCTARARARQRSRAARRRDLRADARDGLRDRRGPAAGDGLGGGVRAHARAPRRRGLPGAVRKLRRQVLPIYSLIVLTEPLSEARWAGIGWEGPRVRGVQPLHGRLPLAHRRRAHILRGPGRALPLWFAHKGRVRPPRADARDAAPHGAGVVPGHRGRPVYPRVGSPAVPRDWMPTMS